MGWRVARRAGQRKRAPLKFKRDFDGYMDKALATMMCGRFEEAETVLAAAKRHWPLEPRVTVMRARMRMLQGDFSPTMCP